MDEKMDAKEAETFITKSLNDSGFSFNVTLGEEDHISGYVGNMPGKNKEDEDIRAEFEWGFSTIVKVPKGWKLQSKATESPSVSFEKIQPTFLEKLRKNIFK